MEKFLRHIQPGGVDVLDLVHREGGDAGTPVVVSQPESPAGEALLQAARELAKQTRTLVRKPLGLTVAPGAGNGHAGHEHAHAGHNH